MAQVTNIVKWILDCGSPVMMPIIITLFGMAFRQGLGKSLRSGLTVGIGLIGMNTMIALVTGNLGPAAKAMVTRYGLSLTGMDVTVASVIAWGLPTATLIIPIILFLNALLVVLKITKTFHIDIWNYWHFALSAGLVWIATGNMLLAWAIAIGTAIVTYLVADWTYPAMEDPETFGLPGITLPHAGTVVWAPLMYALNKLLDMIPGVKDLHADPEALRKRFGVIGEPIFIGLALGLLIGVLAGYKAQAVLALGVTMSAGLILLPRVISLIVEGLIPLADGIREQMIKWFPGRDLRIGMDAAIVTGRPSLLASAYILAPIALVLAIILPGNITLPYSILPVLMFPLIWADAPSKGNVVRTLIGGVLIIIVMLYGSTLSAPFITKALTYMKVPLPAGAVLVADMVAGGRQLFSVLVLLWVLPLTGNAPMSMLYIAAGATALYAFCWWWAWDEPKKCAARRVSDDYVEAAPAATGGDE